ncbi:MAG: permease-like cell division protein FtsX [Bacteroidales bacterium]|nr:permease-like cell division protein FtsX [Candidatus Cryptobacteroides faecihippi]
MIRRRLVGSWLSTVISISLVLLLVGVASLLLVNAKGVSDYFKENMQVSVLMKTDVDEAETAEFQAVLDSMPCVRSTSLVSREQGMKEMSDLLGEDFLNVFEASPIPVSIDVSLKADYVSAESIEAAKKQILEYPIVDEVVYQQSLVDKLNTNLGKISLVLGVLIVLLLFISYVLINNTVRLNVFSKRFTIHTMKLVGATKGFIRGPFLVQSIFQGLFSSLVAILILLAILFFIRKEFVQLFEVFSLDLLLVVMGIVVVSGVLICLVSTFFVVGRLVSLSKDELYC